MINVAVCGANGKMGQEVVKAVHSADDMTLVAQIDIFNGQFASIKDAKDSVKIDVLIDFTQPASIYENALYCLKDDKGEILGTISLDDDEAVDSLPCWSKELQPGAELSRLGVKVEYQNQGIAKYLFLVFLRLPETL